MKACARASVRPLLFTYGGWSKIMSQSLSHKLPQNTQMSPCLVQRLDMISHVVLLQPKPETTAEELAACLKRVQALQQVIPVIIAISAGENRSAYHQGFTHGIIIHFIY